MARPYLLTLEYPPSPARSESARAGKHGGIAKYLEGEVKASPVQVVVSVVDGKNWKQLIWSERKKFKGCDGLWISHVLPMGYIALAWKWIYKTPYRVYLHGLDLVRPKQSKWKSFWVKKILTNADEIAVNSRATEELLKYYKINPDRARVQYPRINLPLPEGEIQRGWEEKAKFLRKKYNITDKPILLTISRLVKRKGIDLVIKSLPEVWQKIPDLVYVVVGEGEDRERLNVIAREQSDRGNPDNARGDGQIASPLARNDKILFVGSVTDEEKYGWLSACNCFILTPIDDPNDFEGYGIVYKEAQMFNKPVIGSSVGGVPEAVGDNGVLVEAGNIEQITSSIIKIIKKEAS